MRTSDANQLQRPFEPQGYANKKIWEKFSRIFHRHVFEKERLKLKICDTYTIMKRHQSFSSFAGTYMLQFFPGEIKVY